MTVNELIHELAKSGELQTEVEVIVRNPFGMYRITSVTVNREAWPHFTEIKAESIGDTPEERIRMRERAEKTER